MPSRSVPVSPVRAPSRLRTLRLRAGLTQADLAVKAGVSLGYVGMLERTPGLLRAGSAAKLAAALGVQPTEILQRSAE